MPEPLLVLIPVKALARAKSRLRLSRKCRREVASVLADHTLRTVAKTFGAQSLWVVTADPEIQELTRELGGTAIDDPYGGDLNLALTRSLSRIPLNFPVLLMVSDLPLLSPEDIVALAAEVTEFDEPQYVTDAAGTGTTAVYLPAGWRLPLLFGVGSALRFCRAGWRSVPLAPRGVRADLDTLADLEAYGLPGHRRINSISEGEDPCLIALL